MHIAFKEFAKQAVAVDRTNICWFVSQLAQTEVRSTAAAMNACLALVVSQPQASLHRKIAPLDDTGFRDRLAKASLLPCDLALVGAWESGKEEIPAKLAAWLEVLAKTQGAWQCLEDYRGRQYGFKQ